MQGNWIQLLITCRRRSMSTRKTNRRVHSISMENGFCWLTSHHRHSLTSHYALYLLTASSVYRPVYVDQYTSENRPLKATSKKNKLKIIIYKFSPRREGKILIFLESYLLKLSLIATIWCKELFLKNPASAGRQTRSSRYGIAKNRSKTW